MALTMASADRRKKPAVFTVASLSSYLQEDLSHTRNKSENYLDPGHSHAPVADIPAQWVMPLNLTCPPLRHV